LTVAGVQTELLGRWALIAQALLLAADFICSARCSIDLSLADIALTGRGIGRIATRAQRDTVPLTADLAVGTGLGDTLASAAGLAHTALRLAATTMIVIGLGIDTLTITTCLGVGALALSKLARAPRITGMATGATIVGIGFNVDARPAAADFVGHAQAAIAVLTVLEPLVIEDVRLNLAAETRELQPRMVAEAAAGGLLVEEHFLKGGVLTMGDATADRSSARSVKCASDQRGG